ncbi:hypothetical protein A3B21_02080 [Candidatus Uhrbacteria bacterium RIFCSPLOWO2_01_FULL_47_24]|uniref:Uncharacterized protein n=1 Tax=Candidatus Uhrbacteria bacterium RIFCSPLOWO2_01_FULL_47_24 TaxID=1802401 RepID=A0A1F7UPB5_9BACT|nr:MAG: hypothetical protein A2753_01830 [Candidatus Uhrbacteria bacterium RIFCSPHIGHO2_01_FULL_47_11]OGL67957.1 MAG: hypothetical protein A3D58_05275 [Candidatus Uhrbacteria bacterium RIFCSPHIGHO2_02_FULL_46_47]OGL76446.1 MAG: hypothetical protein A3F52_02915 [Candidatus Uhrbacteria bacterium RIFCSPHIGHO2_12_FULL_47_11]OGL80143.1 MAG: hypothetical protein A3B21_02080 [Candidatus Uhrbacteria bacterium RIFCSPLOWO2_01_FULL_47_24]OGL84927.1 MAG: hypothetical protein A3J03_04460 [Candidatus Uhrbact
MPDQAPTEQENKRRNWFEKRQRLARLAQLREIRKLRDAGKTAHDIEQDPTKKPDIRLATTVAAAAKAIPYGIGTIMSWIIETVYIAPRRWAVKRNERDKEEAAFSAARVMGKQAGVKVYIAERHPKGFLGGFLEWVFGEGDYEFPGGLKFKPPLADYLHFFRSVFIIISLMIVTIIVFAAVSFVLNLI